MAPADSTPEFTDSPPTDLPQPATISDRLWAFAEVVLCSSFPTQLLIMLVMSQAGWAPLDDKGQLSSGYVFRLALADSVLLTGLIILLLVLHGEKPRRIFLGTRRVLSEALIGLWLIPLVVGLMMTLMLTLSRVVPWLRNVPRNPLEALIDSGAEAGLFALVAIVAGGVREEIQRAFILHRFEQYLGGVWVGLVVFSLVFGLGHAIQGWDAAIATAVLGAFWGFVYIVRRSVVAPVVSHSGFNTLEIVRFMLVEH